MSIALRSTLSAAKIASTQNPVNITSDFILCKKRITFVEYEIYLT